MAEGLDRLPDDGAVLTKVDLDALDAKRSHAVDIAVALTQALGRQTGGDE